MAHIFWTTWPLTSSSGLETCTQKTFQGHESLLFQLLCFAPSDYVLHHLTMFCTIWLCFAHCCCECLTHLSSAGQWARDVHTNIFCTKNNSCIYFLFSCYVLATVAKVWPDYYEESTGERRGHKNFPPARKLDPKTNYNKNNPSVTSESQLS